MTVTLLPADLTLENAATFPAGSKTDRIVEAAALAIDRYAPTAPDDVSDEALVRYATALATSAAQLNRHSITTGDIRIRFVVDDADLFRRCGAKALLSPYRVRRGLAPVTTEDLDS